MMDKKTAATQIKQIQSISIGLAAAGHVGGLIYAINKKKSGWGKLGYFLLGGIIVSIPVGIIINPMIIKRKAILNSDTSTSTGESSFTGLAAKKGCGKVIYRGRPVNEYGQWCNGKWISLVK